MKYAAIFVIGLVIGLAVSLLRIGQPHSYSRTGVDKVYTDMAIKEIKSEPGNHDEFLKNSDSVRVDGQRLVCVIFYPTPGYIYNEGVTKAYCFDKFKNNYVGSF